jgi:peptidoglycan/xylan/chitin deacetylase (PgdA/CDA1 family)
VVRFLERWARRLRAHRSVILCYHGVGQSDARIDPVFLRVRPVMFGAQLDLLEAAGFEFTTVSNVADLAARRRLPPGLVALTFDDGMDDNHAVVLPILRERRLPATVYVTTGLIGKPNPWMDSASGARMMTVAELRELVAAGFEIGAHSVTHPDFSQLDFESCLHEARESRIALEQLLGVGVRTFAYPFCRYHRDAVAAVRAAGFSAAVTCEQFGGRTPYELKRALITGKDGLATFLLKLADVYHPIVGSLPARATRAVSRRIVRAGRVLRESPAATRSR